MRRELIQGVGRHSRKGPGPSAPVTGQAETNETGRAGTGAAPGTGRRRRAAGPAAEPFPGAPEVRGGHPEQREAGGGWGAGPMSSAGAQAPPPGLRPGAPHPARHPRPAGDRPLIPGPRREFVEAFDSPPAPPRRPAPEDPYRSVTEWDPHEPEVVRREGAAAVRAARGAKGRTITGIAAAAVTTVLAVVVAGQVPHDRSTGNETPSTTGVDREDTDDASRSDGRTTPSPEPASVKPLTYEQKMAKAYPLSPALTGSGTFETVPGTAEAPGKGTTHRYRIDVEKGIGLDADLFAQAVQRTLNDDRSWAHDGDMTFERISEGEPDFVITLASPGTTGTWCAKSGLDTMEDNVSCDSAATERVMINAYRWAQGAATFGPERLFAYRQMLINHEVGHRLGHNHASCGTEGALAPVMQQQTKTLDLNGVKCRPNPWVYPED
ncbi:MULTISPECIES: DUF3152 domain-containing protein [unclassified Streptomyces]|uniref:DUF3152 domain-containing protein n=1 Tax=unclassified Streptomyces TaxID=2593676 RepID=UPI000DACF0D6|nr:MULTISPECIES: DUF3152 domain-containing protein [unclassified Streptomyces]PZT76515.1 hypothetical protein DNK56_24640 [Streptomyces sp. AC1-42W]PZT79528.1 hypothetical protein DNK55_08025 [Streptomyces sp. AC1-42T]